jgi:hypothetical protein
LQGNPWLSVSGLYHIEVSNMDAEGIAINNNVYHVVIMIGSTSVPHEVNKDNFPNQWL